MISRLLSWMFPSPALKGDFHPADLRGIMGYQERLQRAQGEDYTFERMNFTIGTRVGKVMQGVYVDVSEHANSRLHYDATERTLVAVYPIEVVPEPTVEEVSVEALEAVYTQDDRDLAVMVDVLLARRDGNEKCVDSKKFLGVYHEEG